MGELLVILVMVLLIFGASRLPQIGEAMGKSIKNFQRGLRSEDDINVTSKNKNLSAKSSAEELPHADEKPAEAEVIDKKP
jgi:sec-independent protein translocase protein TatA